MIPRHARAILVVRLSARGDLVFASPLARALRRRFPRARIAWAAEERTADVVRHNPHLDEVIVVERAKWKRMLLQGRWSALASAVADFAELLRSRRFDAVVDAQGLLRSGLLAFLTGAPVRIGLGSREGSRIFMTHFVERGGEPRKIASEYAHMAAVLGLPVEPFRLEVPRSPEEIEAGLRLLAAEGVALADPPSPGFGPAAPHAGFVAACPFTTRSYKHWFEDRWSRLIGALPARTGLGVVLLGGPGDRAAADRILAGAETTAAVADPAEPGMGPDQRPAAGTGATRASPRCSGGRTRPDQRPATGASAPPVVNLVGRTTLAEASAVVAACSVLVGVDTGLSHMAHAYDRPAVLLFGSNTPYLDPPSGSVSILHSGRSCSPCRGKLVCHGRIDCMSDLSVESVLTAVEARLAAAAHPSSHLSKAAS